MREITKGFIAMLILLAIGFALGWTVNDLTMQVYCWEDYAAKMSRCITVP